MQHNNTNDKTQLIATLSKHKQHSITALTSAKTQYESQLKKSILLHGFTNIDSYPNKQILEHVRTLTFKKWV